MSAPRKYDPEFRVVGGPDVSRAASRDRGVQAQRPAACRGAVGPESGDVAELGRGTGPGRVRTEPAPRSAEAEEVRALRRRVAELERANEILKTSAAFFAQAELDRRLK